MKSKTHPGPCDPTDAHRRQLAAWLQEWRIDQALRTDLPAATGTPPQPAAPRLPPAPTISYLRARTADTLRAGQIHLLFPTAIGSPAERPLYVLLMEKRPDGSFLVAPFSRFSSPAIPGEWRTGLRASPLRVLCAWNARRVPASVLRRGWRAGVMRPDKLRRALAVCRHARSGAPLEGIASAELGPPLRHPLDPRHAYLAEEAALLDEHIPAADPAAETAQESTSLTYELPRSSVRLAAERPPPYGRPKKRAKPNKRP